MTPRRLFSFLILVLLGAALAAPVRADDAAGADGTAASASVQPAKAPKKKKKAAKKKPYDYEQSKYKAYKELVADDSHSYRFDERGNPIPVGGKKKASAKKKKTSDDDAPSCEAGEACQDNDAGAESKSSETPAD